MKTLNHFSLILIAALALAGTAYAQVPASNGTSDGGENTGIGLGALGGPAATNGGNSNTAAGASALASNNAGVANNALGQEALESNTGGNFNTAVGHTALLSNTVGNLNTASGYRALLQNTIGNNNVAAGAHAGFSVTGDYNIAIGADAGSNLTTGNNNIDIGNVGVAGESNVIRIGTRGTHKATVIAGIIASQVTGSAVYVTTAGRLGVLASSERYKTAIAPIGASTGKLRELRPVSFHLKADPKGAVQYGLIAEEVAKVYPELVIRNEAGRIDGVRYDELAPMLLNEVQQLQQRIADQDAKISRLMELAEKHGD